MKVIGFCGKAGSGKSTVLKAIENLGVIVSMGDVIRNEAKDRNHTLLDENLGKISLELRKNFGSEIIAEKCVELIKTLDHEIIFVDGLRSPAEVRVFRKSWTFPVVAVIVDDKTRFERLSKRGRPDDPNNLEDLRDRDKRENALGLTEVMKNANYIVDNNVSEKEVQKKTRDLILNLINNY
jgi:dephospho-CoA kinase